MCEMTLPCSAEELLPLNPSENFLLPQQKDRRWLRGRWWILTKSRIEREVGAGREGNNGYPTGKLNWEVQDSGCHGLTHMREEREVEVSPELLNGAATPVLKHVQVGLALELEGKSGAP